MVEVQLHGMTSQQQARLPLKSAAPSSQQQARVPLKSAAPCSQQQAWVPLKSAAPSSQQQARLPLKSAAPCSIKQSAKTPAPSTHSTKHPCSIKQSAKTPAPSTHSTKHPARTPLQDVSNQDSCNEGCEEIVLTTKKKRKENVNYPCSECGKIYAHFSKPV